MVRALSLPGKMVDPGSRTMRIRKAAAAGWDCLIYPGCDGGCEPSESETPWKTGTWKDNGWNMGAKLVERGGNGGESCEI